MKYIIIIILSVISISVKAQIDPYQIIKDSLGAHRILLTDSTGEYTRVLLRDAIADSIGVGKFVNGTDPLDAVYMDGSVGIGTLTPSEKLEVVGNVEAEEFIGDLRGSVLFKAQAGEALTKGDVVYISGISGNTTIVSKADADDITKMPAFGVASTDVGLNNPADIYTFGTLSNINTSSFSLGDELYIGTISGGLVNAAPSGESSQIQKIAKVTRVHSSTGSIKVMGAGRTNATPNLNEGRLFVGNSSNKSIADGTIHVDVANERVGIGTTSPNRMFTINGNGAGLAEIRSLNSSVNLFLQSDGTTNESNIYFGRDGNGSAGQIRYKHSVDAFTFSNGGSNEKMRIDTDGNVGIGLVQPENKLHIWMDDLGVADTTFLAVESGYGTDNNIFEIGTKIGDGYLKVKDAFDNSKVEILSDGNSFFNGGNVGIGTTNPDKLLVVTGDDAQIVINDTDGTDTPRLRLRESGATSGSIYTDNKELIFDSGTTEKMRIDTDGRLGIGTNSPSALIDVEGESGTISSIKLSNTDVDLQLSAYTDTHAEIRVASDHDLLFKTNGNNTRMTIDNVGDVGIGKQPTEKLDVDGNIKYSGTMFNGTRQEFVNSNIVKVNQIYNGSLVGSYFVAGDYQKVLEITPDGNSEGYHITGNIYVQSGAEVQTLQIDVSLRSNTLPDLDWEISYNNNHTGVVMLKPFLWTKETTTASVILGFEVLNSTIYGSATAELTINCRNSNDKDNIVLNDVAASDQLTIDAGFTEQDFDLKIESAPSVPIISNGQFVGKYPKDSDLQNVMFGYNNLSSHTTGTNNFVSGQYNATASTSNQRSFINGERNFRYATPSVAYSFANGYNNNANNLGSAVYSFLNGIYNLEDSQNLSYVFANGRENGKDLVQANYSFFSGYRNAYNSTANTNYNTFIGRENAVGAADIDYSVFLGYQNNFSGNSSNIDYSFIAGERNAYNAGSMFATNIMGYRNAYTTSNTLNYFTAIGRENAYYPTVPMNNTILLGYRQAYNVGSEGAGSYKLAIGMYEDNPLIYGEFDNALVKINGDLNVGGDLQSRLNLNSKKDGSWVSGSYMSQILFTSNDTSGASGASTRASIRTEAVDAGGSPVADGSDVQLVFKIKGDVAGNPPDAMILHSNKDLEILGGLEVADRTGTANKSAFFDTDGKLVEGDLVSGGQSVTCKIETTSNQTISSTGSPFVVFDSQTIDNGSLSSDLTNNKITINED